MNPYLKLSHNPYFRLVTTRQTFCNKSLRCLQIHDYASLLTALRSRDLLAIRLNKANIISINEEWARTAQLILEMRVNDLTTFEKALQKPNNFKSLLLTLQFSGYFFKRVNIELVASESYKSLLQAYYSYFGVNDSSNPQSMLIRTDIKLSDHLLTTFSCLHDPEIMRIIKTCQLRLLEKLIASKHTVKFQVLKTILSPVLFNVTDYPKLSIYLDNYGFPEGAENLQCIEEQLTYFTTFSVVPYFYLRKCVQAVQRSVKLGNIKLQDMMSIMHIIHLIVRKANSIFCKDYYCLMEQLKRVCQLLLRMSLTIGNQQVEFTVNNCLADSNTLQSVKSAYLGYQQNRISTYEQYVSQGMTCLNDLDQNGLMDSLIIKHKAVVLSKEKNRQFHQNKLMISLFRFAMLCQSWTLVSRKVVYGFMQKQLSIYNNLVCWGDLLKETAVFNSFHKLNTQNPKTFATSKSIKNPHHTLLKNNLLLKLAMFNDVLESIDAYSKDMFQSKTDLIEHFTEVPHESMLLPSGKWSTHFENVTDLTRIFDLSYKNILLCLRNDNLFLCSIIKLGYTNILAWKTREYAMIDRWEYPYHYKAMFQTNQAKDIKYIFSMKYFPNKLWPLRNKNHVKYLKLDDQSFKNLNKSLETFCQFK